MSQTIIPRTRSKPWVFSSHEISVQDKFIDWTEFRIFTPSRLLNPTIKIHNGNTIDINNHALHYAEYELEAAGGTVTVNQPIHVSNQFGEFDVNQLTAARLLVPSQSLLPLGRASDDPVNAEHYLCYDIPEMPVDVAQGTISDEFRSREFIITKAKAVCTPTAKIHGNKLYNILYDYDSNHLMCFTLEKKRIVKIMTLLNQFGSKGVMVTKDYDLCIPSTVTLPNAP